MVLSLRVGLHNLSIAPARIPDTRSTVFGSGALRAPHEPSGVCEGKTSLRGPRRRIRDPREGKGRTDFEGRIRAISGD